jgi:hypothetical protein
VEGGWGRGTTADKSVEERADIILLKSMMERLMDRLTEGPVKWLMKGLIKG